MSALTELLATLRATETKLDQARGDLAAGRRSLSEAQAELAQLDPDHPDTVVPPEMRRADDQIERTLVVVAQVADTLRAFGARL